MKRLIIATMLVGSMAGSAAMAISIPSSGTIQGYQNTGGASSYSNGGEFDAVVDGDISFVTFCIEIHNDFNPGSTYDYTLGQATHNNPLGASPLRAGTAWLFSQFEEGKLNLSGGTSSTAANSIGALQAALWYFQGQDFSGEGDYGAWGNGAQADDIFTADAIAALGGQQGPVVNGVQEVGTGAFSANGDNNVQVLEVTNGQDWLVQVPDGGMTVGLLGAGLIGLGALRRKLA